MKKEIGSEFWDIPVTIEKNALFPESVEWFISGRSALIAIISESKIRTIAIPFWCCESMIIPFLRAGIEVKFYKEAIPETDAVLVMDYFGYINRKPLDCISSVVIRDVTHSIFSKKYEDADYYFGSMRKWAGFWTGGYAWGFRHPVTYTGADEGYIELRKDAMMKKESYISEITSINGVKDKEFLEIFGRAEEKLDNIGIYPADPRDIEKAYYFDIDLVKKKRRENAQVLLDAFSDIAIYPVLEKDDCPLFVPIMIKNRNELRNILIQNDIYCPNHWPISEYHDLNSYERSFYEEELSLVCDQRYEQEDMVRIVNVIKDNWKMRK